MSSVLAEFAQLGFSSPRFPHTTAVPRGASGGAVSLSPPPSVVSLSCISGVLEVMWTVGLPVPSCEGRFHDLDRFSFWLFEGRRIATLDFLVLKGGKKEKHFSKSVFFSSSLTLFISGSRLAFESLISDRLRLDCT